MADAPGIPLRLSGAGAGHGSMDFGGPSAIQFTQNLAGSRVHGGNATDRELDVGRHLRKVYAASGARARGRLPNLKGLPKACPHMKCHPERSEGSMDLHGVPE